MTSEGRRKHTFFAPPKLDYNNPEWTLQGRTGPRATSRRSARSRRPTVMRCTPGVASSTSAGPIRTFTPRVR